MRTTSKHAVWKHLSSRFLAPHTVIIRSICATGGSVLEAGQRNAGITNERRHS